MNEDSKIITNISVRHMIIFFIVPTVLGILVSRFGRMIPINPNVVRIVLNVGITLALICTMKVPINKPPKTRGISFDFSAFCVVYVLIWFKEGLLWLQEVVGFSDHYNLIGYSTVSYIADEIKRFWFHLFQQEEVMISVVSILLTFIWNAIYAKLIMDRTYGLGGNVAIWVCALLMGMYSSSWVDLVINILMHVYLAETYVRTGRIGSYAILPLVATALAVFSNIYLDIEFIGDYVGLEWLAVNHIYGIVEKALLLYGGFRLLEFVFGAFKLEANKKKLIFKNVGMLLWMGYCLLLLIRMSFRMY